MNQEILDELKEIRQNGQNLFVVLLAVLLIITLGLLVWVTLILYDQPNKIEAVFNKVLDDRVEYITK